MILTRASRLIGLACSVAAAIIHATPAGAQSGSVHVGMRIVDCGVVDCTRLKQRVRPSPGFPTLTRQAAAAIRKDPRARVILDPRTGLSKIIVNGTARWAYLP